MAVAVILDDLVDAPEHEDGVLAGVHGTAEATGALRLAHGAVWAIGRAELSPRFDHLLVGLGHPSEVDVEARRIALIPQLLVRLRHMVHRPLRPLAGAFPELVSVGGAGARVDELFREGLLGIEVFEV